MPYHAYDRAPARRWRFEVGNGIDCHALADGIPIWPKAARETRIHYGDELRARVIRIARQPPSDKGNLHRLKVFGCDRALVDFHVRKIAQLLQSGNIWKRRVFEEDRAGRLEGFLV